MASIRDNICNALVARLAAINGWKASLRGASNDNDDNEVQAVVFFVSEDKRIRGNQHYDATMQVVVMIECRMEDADPVADAGNPYRYLDRLVTEAEKTIHSPDAWGLSPDFTDVAIGGHDVSDPTENNTLTALLRVTFNYRHDYQNPEA
jgi:hypothetical protein